MKLGQLIDITTYRNYLKTYYDSFVRFFMFLLIYCRGETRQSKNNKYHVLKINGSHYISILLKSESVLDPFSVFPIEIKVS